VVSRGTVCALPLCRDPLNHGPNLGPGLDVIGQSSRAQIAEPKSRHGSDEYLVQLGLILSARAKSLGGVGMTYRTNMLDERLPLQQKLKLSGHLGIEWFEYVVFLFRRLSVINSNVSQAQVVVCGR
jgi:hypothetical protein